MFVHLVLAATGAPPFCSASACWTMPCWRHCREQWRTVVTGPAVVLDGINKSQWYVSDVSPFLSSSLVLVHPILLAQAHLHFHLFITSLYLTTLVQKIQQCCPLVLVSTAPILIEQPINDTFRYLHRPEWRSCAQHHRFDPRLLEQVEPQVQYILPCLTIVLVLLPWSKTSRLSTASFLQTLPPLGTLRWRTHS